MLKVFKKGELLVSEGDFSKSIYLLVSGRLGIFKGKIKVSEFSDQGVIVGEMSSLLGEKRTASVKALENTSVIVIEKGIDELIEQYPNIAKKMMIGLAERLKNTTQEFWMLANEISEAYVQQTGKK